MSENQNRGVRDFTMYDSMKTEELEEILRLDCEANDGQESDTELLLYVMGVLAERKKNSNTQEITAQQAWESFQSNYLPVNKEPLTLVMEKHKASTQAWFRRLIAAAAVIAILICIPVMTNAFGWEDIWKAVASWAKETFSFVTDRADATEPHKSDSRHFTSLQQALIETGIDDDIIPTWIPIGYELKDITVGESPMQKVYTAFYSREETPLNIYVHVFLTEDPEKTEIGQDPIEVYEARGVEYYIFENTDQMQIIWGIDSYECCISCELTIEEIKMMIDSIGKG